MIEQSWIENLMAEALQLPEAAIPFHVGRALDARLPGKSVLPLHRLNVWGFAREGHCQVRPREGLYHQFQAYVAGEDYRLYWSPENTWLEIAWNGHTLHALSLSWPTQHYSSGSPVWLVGDEEETGRAFLEAIRRWSDVVEEEVLVFDGGSWDKDEELFRAIQSATFDNLILEGDLKHEIRRDVESFLASRATYERYGIPWKRGILFIGPPGNGKTHTVKALINALGVPCIYVRSFESNCQRDHFGIRAVFDKARELTPCILVFEDLDALIKDETRSFFLNELDGFAQNTGIVLVATTNHPERLDTAILDRPSRFDRKYHFALPAFEQRRDYLALWNARLQEEMRLTQLGLDCVAGATEEFSFAYLKELMLSSMMRWIEVGISASMDEVMPEVALRLREQMRSLREPAAEPEPAAALA